MAVSHCRATASVVAIKECSPALLANEKPLSPTETNQIKSVSIHSNPTLLLFISLLTFSGNVATLERDCDLVFEFMILVFSGLQHKNNIIEQEKISRR